MTISCPVQSSINTKSIQDGIEWDEYVWLDSRAEEIKTAILSEDGYTVNSATYNMSDVLEEIANSEFLTEIFEKLLLAHVLKEMPGLKGFIGGVANGMANQFAADELASMNSDEGV